MRACGKVLVTQSDEEITRLEELHRRAIANGVTVVLGNESGLARLKPLVLSQPVAPWSLNTAVASPGGDTQADARVPQRLGREVSTSIVVEQNDCALTILRDGMWITARHIVNAAGL